MSERFVSGVSAKIALYKYYSFHFLSYGCFGQRCRRCWCRRLSYARRDGHVGRPATLGRVSTLPVVVGVGQLPVACGWFRAGRKRGRFANVGLGQRPQWATVQHVRQVSSFATPAIYKITWLDFNLLTVSGPVVSNSYTLRCPGPYLSNPPFLIFDVRALWRSVLSVIVDECQKIQKGS